MDDLLEKAINTLCDHVQSIIDHPGPPPVDWYDKANLYVTKVRDLMDDLPVSREENTEIDDINF